MVARIDIDKRVSDVKSVYYAADRYVDWGTINRFEFVEAKRSPMNIRKGEIIYVRYSRKDGRNLWISGILINCRNCRGAGGRR